MTTGHNVQDRWRPKKISELGKEPQRKERPPKPGVGLILCVHAFAEPSPGLGCYGWVGVDAQTGEVRAEDCSSVGGNATSVLAGYHAVIRGLLWAHVNNVPNLVVRSDLQILVSQINGQTTCFSPRLRLVLDRITKAKRLMNISFEHIPAEENQQAVALARYIYSRLTGHEAPDRHVA